MGPSANNEDLEKDDAPTLSITEVIADDGEACNNVRSEDYGSQFAGVVRELFLDESMLDITLCASGHKIRAHRMVLSACSQLFQELLSDSNEDQTIFIPDVNLDHLQAIVSFCYNGEIRVPSTEITELLTLAQQLKIEGLREVAGLVESDASNDQAEDDEPYFQESTFVYDEDSDGIEEVTLVSNTTANNSKITSTYSTPNSNKTFKRKRSSSKKEYSDNQLAAAIKDICAGKSLLEAAEKHSIPKSTLYMRAKALGVKINTTKVIYTAEDMKEAVKSVSEGCSLQQAAVVHGIPKTVLWRRVQKEGVPITSRDKRKSYGSERREAAVKALERGETLSKVSMEYKIPKTTLFRDKTRLINQGKLPKSFWKRRKSLEDEQKQNRLEKAVLACKTGRMSQAAASLTYQIPKTTIWRHLHKELKECSSPTPVKPNKIENTISIRKSQAVVKSEESNEDEFEPYCPEETEMNITYINEENMEEPVMILTSADGDELNLSSEKQNYIVVQDGTSGDNFIPSEIGNFENPSFTKS
ncbi:uncharacterized protein LOC106640281 [Copidosoma floridanum]|uniref:uncharacterized protein LOC106640281 n=1 Tax=Copidosoma floridanum TaxID=29053 RepID=UPI0006C949CC|nr:uncharacterized protein LOC106640281 [Copidosoma floridanum]